MDRLKYIKLTDPEWGCLIQDLLDTNPEFVPYIDIVPISRYPMGYGRNPGEPHVPHMPQNIFEHLIYYITEAGVNRNYAHKQWDIISTVLRKNNYDLTMIPKALIQPKKIQTYLDLSEYLKLKDIRPENITIEDIKNPAFKIKGIGIGAVAQLKLFYSSDNDIASFSDRGFIQGFMKIYALKTKPTITQMKKTVEKWGYAQRAGEAMCFQVFHYGL